MRNLMPQRGMIGVASHTAIPTARLYGWLPLSDAYGIFFLWICIENIEAHQKNTLIL
ncbi:MAG: hypothetical protein IJP74_13055 [Prevotella sp.]|nr:hypothetical protein [Prevotella sp.]MBR0050220.1 hypothetical protein [Prevotella sp.]